MYGPPLEERHSGGGHRRRFREKPKSLLPGVKFNLYFLNKEGVRVVHTVLTVYDRGELGRRGRTPISRFVLKGGVDFFISGGGNCRWE
jgi:hypothetical protein